MTELKVGNNGSFFTKGKDIAIIEMGHDDVTISCTQGKIILWFGRQVSESLIREIIFGISNIDSSVNHEQEIICDYNTIAEYENMGYVLTSYLMFRFQKNSHLTIS